MISGADDGGTSENTLRLWDIETGRCLRTFEGHTGEVRAVAVLPDGRRALSGAGWSWEDENTLKLWDLESQGSRSTPDNCKGMTWMALSPDRLLALSREDDGTLRLWSLRTGQCQRTFDSHVEWITPVALLPDGRRAISGSHDRALKLWDLQTGQCLRTFEGHLSEVNDVAVLPDGHRAISAAGDVSADDNTLRLWDLQTGQCLRTFEGHTKYVHSLQLLLDGNLAISESGDETRKLWNVQTGQCVRTLEKSSRLLALPPDGSRALLRARGDRTRQGALELVDMRTGQCLRTFGGDLRDTPVGAVFPDGRRAISWHGSPKIWDLDSEECLRSLNTVPPGMTADVALFPDGRRAISYSGEFLIPHGAGGGVRQLPDGSRAITLSYSDGREYSYSDDRFTNHKTLKLWDLQTSTCLHTFEGHSGDVRHVAVLPGGHLAISSCSKHLVKVWDTDSGRCVGTFEAGRTVWSLDIRTDILVAGTGGRPRYLLKPVPAGRVAPEAVAVAWPKTGGP
jgi:WD40 repeat protein